MNTVSQCSNTISIIRKHDKTGTKVHLHMSMMNLSPYDSRDNSYLERSHHKLKIWNSREGMWSLRKDMLEAFARSNYQNYLFTVERLWGDISRPNLPLATKQHLENWLINWYTKKINICIKWNQTYLSAMSNLKMQKLCVHPPREEGDFNVTGCRSRLCSVRSIRPVGFLGRRPRGGANSGVFRTNACELSHCTSCLCSSSCQQPIWGMSFRDHHQGLAMDMCPGSTGAAPNLIAGKRYHAADWCWKGISHRWSVSKGYLWEQSNVLHPVISYKNWENPLNGKSKNIPKPSKTPWLGEHDLWTAVKANVFQTPCTSPYATMGIVAVKCINHWWADVS